MKFSKNVVQWNLAQARCQANFQFVTTLISIKRDILA